MQKSTQEFGPWIASKPRTLIVSRENPHAGNTKSHVSNGPTEIAQ